LNVILAIPMSLLGTVAVIYFLGYTFNTFTLLGMALAVGIVVDDAIMVMENIFRHAEGGKPLVASALEGTREIAFAALAATLAVVAIFLPVVFISGVIGRFFLQFGVTLCVAVLLSYVEAVTLAPARCAQFIQTSREGRSRIGKWVDVSFKRLETFYSGILGKSLKTPVWILVGAAVLFGLSILVFSKLPSEFVPSQDQSVTMVRLQTAVGSSLEETDRLIRKVEDWLSKRPEVTRVFGFVGGFGGGVNSGVLFVTLVPPEERKMSMAEISILMRRELNAIPGLRAVIQDISQRGFTGQRGFPVEFSVRGSDWNGLVTESQKIIEKLSASGLVVDLDTDYKLGMPELRIIPDRARAADIGISIDDVAVTLNALVGGVRVGKYSAGGRRIDVRMKLLSGQRSRPEDIAQLQVRTRAGQMVPLSSLVNYLERPALQAITRRDRERAITIFANIAPGHAQQEVLQSIETMGRDLPIGYRLVLSGASVAFRESFGSLLFALWLGILIAYMVLAAQFNSFLHPVTVLTILPLSLTGAAFALLAAGKSLNIFSMIGLLLLMGIVKKNSIILVDYANQFREQGLNASEAMHKAGPIRLRPILMTAIATLMAAVPPALGIGPGSEIRMPMAIAVIGGLVLSTILSLVVVPSFYVVADRGVQKFQRRRMRKVKSPLAVSNEKASEK
ncbi:MAG: efflux RND transporter permease subunit, partial [Deltaproteobacteria bacterium]|nr:efflux RND transporter permease subunit [Deltaproteobacteria bacterium]